VANLSFHLFQLQKIDARVDQIDARLKKIGEITHNNQAVKEADALVKETENTLSQRNLEISELENAANAKRVKIEQSESALYKGTNKSPKELSDLQKEIASLKHVLSELDDQQFLKLSETETLTAEFDKRKESYIGLLSEWEAANQVLVQEGNALQKEKEKLGTERQAVVSQISAENISLYERLRISKNHIAVTAIEDESCTICGAEITAADIQKARNPVTLVTCPSCGRILYSG
jgi:predicted  nucleic acid-binding Zn-ribbon protein